MDDLPSVRGILDASEAALRAHPGPIYRLREWTGRVALGPVEVAGSSWHDDPTDVTYHHSATLTYSRESSFVKVTTTDDREQSLPWFLVVKAEGVRPEKRQDLDPEAAMSGSTRTSTEVEVDGTRRAAEVLSRGDCWAASIDLDEVVVIMAARAVELTDLALVASADLSPWIQDWIDRTNHLR